MYNDFPRLIYQKKKKKTKRKTKQQQPVRIIYSSIIKDTNTFYGVIWHVQQKLGKCFIMLPNLARYTDLFTLKTGDQIGLPLA